MPHGGGARIRPQTRDYEVIRGWVAAGSPFGKDAPTVVKVRVTPKERTLEAGQTAHSPLGSTSTAPPAHATPR
jgi:hypothetical protein